MIVSRDLATTRTAVPGQSRISMVASGYSGSVIVAQAAALCIGSSSPPPW